ncbi:hypothetical protein ERC79_13810 [Rhodococcus sp. ABRD24]|uniref:hypothetical protein n=1 Tax=Rhodococcus sp. ABRD24 TaxID=2507582 RepID=UPI001039BB1D|nr:hypothetical protein [Rhodococcus sp. ABRD24]QBJ96905.1 hypothetical protein ERC79_13810 [Rhodococcus sp. ABRD24]
MTEWRRVNFAIAGSSPEEWTAHLKWSARVLRHAGVEVPDTELSAEIDHEDREQQTRRPIGRRVPPDFRRHPHQQEPALYEPDLSIPFKTRKGVDLRLGRIRVFATGVSFQLIARIPDPHPDQGVIIGAEAMNLGFRIKPGQPHRIRLIVTVDPRRGPYGFYGGTVLANSSSPCDFPEDPGAPWLAGGNDRCVRVGDGELEFAATYFLSPVPTRGKLVFTIAYPEFDIDVTDLILDAAQFTQKPPG